MFDVKKAALEVISELDRIARDYNHYEYGLPNTSGEEQERMVAVVESRINAAVNAAIKRCADIVTEHDVRFGGYGRAPLFVREELRQEIERGVQDQTTATRRQGPEGPSGEATEGSSSG